MVKFRCLRFSGVKSFSERSACDGKQSMADNSRFSFIITLYRRILWIGRNGRSVGSKNILHQYNIHQVIYTDIYERLD